MRTELADIVTELIEEKWSGHVFDEWGASHGPEMGCSICYFIQQFANVGVRAAVLRVNKSPEEKT